MVSRRLDVPSELMDSEFIPALPISSGRASTSEEDIKASMANWRFPAAAAEYGAYNGEVQASLQPDLPHETIGNGKWIKSKRRNEYAHYPDMLNVHYPVQPSEGDGISPRTADFLTPNPTVTQPEIQEGRATEEQYVQEEVPAIIVEDEIMADLARKDNLVSSSSPLPPPQVPRGTSVEDTDVLNASQEEIEAFLDMASNVAAKVEVAGVAMTTDVLKAGDVPMANDGSIAPEDAKMADAHDHMVDGSEQHTIADYDAQIKVEDGAKIEPLLPESGMQSEFDPELEGFLASRASADVASPTPHHAENASWAGALTCGLDESHHEAAMDVQTLEPFPGQISAQVADGSISELQLAPNEDELSLVSVTNHNENAPAKEHDHSQAVAAAGTAAITDNGEAGNTHVVCSQSADAGEAPLIGLNQSLEDQIEVEMAAQGFDVAVVETIVDESTDPYTHISAPQTLDFHSAMPNLDGSTDLMQTNVDTVESNFNEPTEPGSRITDPQTLNFGCVIPNFDGTADVEFPNSQSYGHSYPTSYHATPHIKTKQDLTATTSSSQRFIAHPPLLQHPNPNPSAPPTEVCEAYHTLFSFLFLPHSSIPLPSDPQLLLASLELIISLSKRLGCLDKVRPSLALALSGAISKALYRDVAMGGNANTWRWLRVGLELQFAAVVREAVVSVVGRHPAYFYEGAEGEEGEDSGGSGSGSGTGTGNIEDRLKGEGERRKEADDYVPTDLSPRVRLLIKWKYQQLSHWVLRVNAALLMLHLPGQNGRTTLLVELLFRDWIRLHIASAMRCYNYHHANIYRRLASAEDFRVCPLEDVMDRLQRMDLNPKGEVDKEEVNRVLRELREHAAWIVKDLVGNESMLSPIEEGEIRWLTCTVVENEEFPWVHDEKEKGKQGSLGRG